jgi:Cu(I)/Ag(I) efflux system membrane protein CusA/SilA
MNNVAFIYVIFNENVDLYWARSRVLEYLSGFKFPEGVSFQIGADASAISWIFQYVLVSNKHSIDELTSFNEFFLKPFLQSIEGVSEVGTIGGFLKEYQIDLNPYLMKVYDISFEDVLNAIKNNNQSTGGRYIEISERFYNIRGYGYVKSLEDIENIFVKNSNGKSVKIKDIAIVQLGPSLREGALDFNGKGESVGGIKELKKN